MHGTIEESHLRNLHVTVPSPGKGGPFACLPTSGVPNASLDIGVLGDGTILLKTQSSLSLT